jgi:hypothetical protein
VLKANIVRSILAVEEWNKSMQERFNEKVQPVIATEEFQTIMAPPSVAEFSRKKQFEIVADESYR